MSFFLLTSEQKTLLTTLVGFIEEGKLKEPLSPFPAGNPTTEYVLYLKGEKSFKFKRISDLDSLCDFGLLRYRWNRLGNGRLYYITEAGATAVANNFKAPLATLGQELSLVRLTATLSSGHIMLEGIKDSKTIAEVVGDPILRHTAVTQLITSLQKTAKTLFTWEHYRAYYELCQQLQEELLTDQAKSKKLHAIFSQLAVPQADLLTWPQLWAHLYPLLIIAHLQTG